MTIIAHFLVDYNGFFAFFEKKPRLLIYIDSDGCFCDTLRVDIFQNVVLPLDDLAASDKDARYAFAYVTYHLVVDGVAESCHPSGREGRDLTENQDLVTYVAVDVRDVQHELIHAHPTHDGSGGVTHAETISGLPQRAAEAVGVADGDGGDLPCCRCGIGAAVADGLVGLHGLDVGDDRAQAHDGAQIGVIAQALRGGETVEHDARAHHVQVAFGIVENGGAVGAMADGEGYAHLGQAIDRLGEQRKLCAGVCLAALTLVGGGEMGENTFGLQWG